MLFSPLYQRKLYLYIENHPGAGSKKKTKKTTQCVMQCVWITCNKKDCEPHKIHNLARWFSLYRKVSKYQSSFDGVYIFDRK